MWTASDRAGVSSLFRYFICLFLYRLSVLLSVMCVLSSSCWSSNHPSVCHLLSICLWCHIVIVSQCDLIWCDNKQNSIVSYRSDAVVSSEGWRVASESQIRGFIEFEWPLQHLSIGETDHGVSILCFVSTHWIIILPASIPLRLSLLSLYLLSSAIHDHRVHVHLFYQ